MGSECWKSIKHRRLGNDITRRLNAPGHELVLYNAKRGVRYRLSLCPQSLEALSQRLSLAQVVRLGFRGPSALYDVGTSLTSEFPGFTRIYSSPAVRVGIEELPAPVVRAPFFLAASSCFSCSMFLT